MLSSDMLAPPTTGSRLVLAHGFTQNRRCWGEFGERCTRSFDVRAVDLPGHGWSTHDNASLNEAGSLIVGAGGPAHYLGYSMGGRMLLHAGLQATAGEIRSLILVGATAGIENAAERAQRKASDDQLADRIMQIGTPAFVDEWLTKPMFAGLTPETSAAVKRYENPPDGLASSLRSCGAGVQEPLWDRVRKIRSSLRSASEWCRRSVRMLGS